LCPHVSVPFRSNRGDADVGHRTALSTATSPRHRAELLHQ
jgi:hypothetical protein